MAESAAFYIKAFVTLLVLVNPLEGIPVYLSATAKSGPELRALIVRRAGVAVTVILLVALFLGHALLAAFSISSGAFQVGGGVVLFLIAVQMVFSAGVPALGKTGDGQIGPDFAVVPLAIPLLAGPGPINGAILYSTRTHHAAEMGILAGVILLVGAATYGSLRLSNTLQKYLGDTGISIATRVMGLIIAAIAVEMISHGVASLFGLKVFWG